MVNKPLVGILMGSDSDLSVMQEATKILEELGKWKTLFFPSQMTNKAKALQLSGIEFNYINLGSNKYRGIEATVSGGDSGMVGGC